MTTREQAYRNTLIDTAQNLTARLAWQFWQEATDPFIRDYWRDIFTLCVERCR